MNVLAQTGSASPFILVVMVIIIYVLFTRMQRQSSGSGKKRAAFDSAIEPAGKASYNQPSPDAMVQWEVQMHETARELSARLDSKMGALEQLTREADRAAARLEAALAAAHPDRSHPTTAHRDSVAVDTAEEPSRRPPPSQADALRSASAAEARPQAVEWDQAISPAHLSNDRRYEEIYTLADYGLESSEIAQRVGTPVGEVELILSLRNKR